MSDDLIYEMTMIKQGLADALGVDSSLLHIPFGMMCLGFFYALFRDLPHRAVWSLVAVLMVQFVNEYIDAVQWIRWTGSVNWREAALDVLLTMTLPMLWVVAHGVRRSVAS